MKKTLFISLALILSFQMVFAKKKEEPKIIEVWEIYDKTGVPTPVGADTTVYTFENKNPMNDYSINNAYNGSLGSPLQSKIYFDRTDKNTFLFSKPYDAYYEGVPDLLFYNTSLPFSTLSYNFAGAKVNHDDNFRGFITLNPTKKLNLTGLYNYIGTKGIYYNQATKLQKGGFSGNYSGKWYAASGAAMMHNFKVEENGGIQDEKYITDVDSFGTVDPVYIPTNLKDAQSQYKNYYGFYTQRFHLAHTKYQIDSATVGYNPIASIFTSSRYEVSQKRYEALSTDTAFYKNTYFNKIATLDSARIKELNNVVGISVNEGFSKWFPLSAIFYAEHGYKEYYNLKDTTGIVTFTENNWLLGTELTRRKGEHFLFDANARINIAGHRAGDSELNGRVSTAFKLGTQTVGLTVSGLAKTDSPNFFDETYYSNHFIWENDFDRTFKTNIKASASLVNKWIELNLGVAAENYRGYIYYNTEALPTQNNDNIQILSGNLKLDFNAGIFHWYNRVIYQKTSNAEVLPLPELSLYSNMFIAFKMFKQVLTTQIGADCYYNTAYHAPSYMPATGVFFNQNTEEVGNYPVLSGYLNIHLKTILFYVKYYHFNASFSDRNYFSMPNYPLYPQRWQFGVSANLFN